MSARKPIAVLDTNVIADIYSVHDLIDRFEAIRDGRDVAELDLDAPSLVYRRARARESLLLAMYLDRIGAATFSLHSELLALFDEKVPDDAKAPPGTDYRSDYTRMFLHFVHDQLLPGWESQIPSDPDEHEANDADQALVDKARALGVPLITNEGFSETGYRVGKIAKRAKAAQVACFHPRAFYEGTIDEAGEIGAFLQRFRTEAPKYIEARRRAVGPDATRELLQLVIGTYRLFLLGETDGRGIVRVRLPEPSTR
jgi:hypothetical protein